MRDSEPPIRQGNSFCLAREVAFWGLYAVTAFGSSVGVGAVMIAWLGPRGSGGALSALLTVVPLAAAVAGLRNRWRSMWLAAIFGTFGPPLGFAVLCFLLLHR